MITILIVLIIVQALSTFATIALIGEERKPITNAQANLTIFVSAMIIVFYVILIRELLANG